MRRRRSRSATGFVSRKIEQARGTCPLDNFFWESSPWPKILGLTGTKLQIQTFAENGTRQNMQKRPRNGMQRRRRGCKRTKNDSSKARPTFLHLSSRSLTQVRFGRKETAKSAA